MLDSHQIIACQSIFAITRVILIAFISPEKQFGAQFEKIIIWYTCKYI